MSPVVVVDGCTIKEEGDTSVVNASATGLLLLLYQQQTKARVYTALEVLQHFMALSLFVYEQTMETQRIEENGSLLYSRQQ